MNLTMACMTISLVALFNKDYQWFRVLLLIGAFSFLLEM